MSGDENFSADKPNSALLVGYFEEALGAEEMSTVERLLRESPAWRGALEQLRQGLDFGELSVATVWRRHRLTCPSRERLGLYWIGGGDPHEDDYIRFHLQIIGCRWCAANLADLEAMQQQQSPPSESPESLRRRRIFESSIALLSRPGRDLRSQ